MRKIDLLFARYGESHRNPTNKTIHWICVPLITWSLLAALWAWTPLAAYATIALAVAFYAGLSLPIAVGMLAVAALMILPPRRARGSIRRRVRGQSSRGRKRRASPRGPVPRTRGRG